MTTYGKKYTTNYKRLSNSTTTIDILQKSYTGSTIELTAVDNPLTITWNGNATNILTPSIGSGASIKVLSTPLTMLDLFTEDPQEFMVKVYDGTSSGTLIWQGFVSTTIYTEDYSVSSDLLTEITINANDGMSVLDDIPFLSSTGAIYTGFSDIKDVLIEIFDKVEIKFSSIITCTDLMVTTGYTNLFSGITVNNENYYDEQLYPNTCREVLDAIFGGLGLVVQFLGDKIYIIEPFSLHRPTLAKSYEFYSGYSFTETSTTLGGYKMIGSQIPYYETGQSMDIVKPFNQIEIKYDPYTITELNFDFDDSENQPIESVLPWISGYTNSVLSHRYATGLTFNDWTVINGPRFAVCEQITDNQNIEDVFGTPTYFYRTKYMSYSSSEYGARAAKYTWPMSSIKQDENMFLEFSFNIYVNTKNANNIYNPTEGATEIAELYYGPLKIGVGEFSPWPRQKLWNTDFNDFTTLVRQNDTDWVTVKKKRWKWSWHFLGFSAQRVTYYVRQDESRINDTWTTMVITIPLNSISSLLPDFPTSDFFYGPVSVTFFERAYAGWGINGSGVPFDPSSYVKNYMINNPSIRFLDQYKNPITNSGVSTLATLDNVSYIKKSKLDVKLNNGVGPYGTSRGAFSSRLSSPSGANIKGLYVSGYTECFDTAALISQSLISQYQAPRKNITANLSVPTDMLGIKFKLLNDTYLPGVSFYMIGGTYSDRNESINCSLLEIVSQKEDIPIVTVTPTPTPTPTPTYESYVYLSYSASGHVGGTLQILDKDSNLLMEAYTSPSPQTGSINIPESVLPYTVRGIHVASGIVRFRVCNSNDGTNMYTSNDMIDPDEYEEYLVSPTPTSVYVQITGGDTALDSCPIV